MHMLFRRQGHNLLRVLTMDINNMDTSAVANIVTGAVMNALGLNGSSNNDGSVTPAREEGNARALLNAARGMTGNRNSR